MDGDAEEYWHDAGSEGWESTCEEVEDGAAAEEGETRTGAEGSVSPSEEKLRLV
jgi:hypothetical protein